MFLYLKGNTVFRRHVAVKIKISRRSMRHCCVLSQHEARRRIEGYDVQKGFVKFHKYLLCIYMEHFDLIPNIFLFKLNSHDIKKTRNKLDNMEKNKFTSGSRTFSIYQHISSFDVRNETSTSTPLDS